MATPSLGTLKRWQTELRDWVKFSCNDHGEVEIAYCSMCCTFNDRLQCLRNFSLALIDGVSRGRLKKDQLLFQFVVQPSPLVDPMS